MICSVLLAIELGLLSFGRFFIAPTLVTFAFLAGSCLRLLSLLFLLVVARFDTFLDEGYKFTHGLFDSFKPMFSHEVSIRIWESIFDVIHQFIFGNGRILSVPFL